MAKYLCIRSCYWKDNLYREGEVYSFNTAVPSHFREINDETEAETKKDITKDAKTAKTK